MYILSLGAAQKYKYTNKATIREFNTKNQNQNASCS